ncbi:hypothetical protein L227DRAFT_393294 [Lentinus tigrinus ALCF2SS1-6]|uniref:F-box domain-containing protein n=1 Tax=Lentinus tigrinus ALCF2SS1-6 TaxID=1328759 RepID=A0A5C2SIR3_9APHY|nr:hypothetical protein L227DRAFT_393294 [Lentinus tigrinus ALCF2SS1-6]
MRTSTDVVVNQLPIQLVRRLWFGPMSSFEKNGLKMVSTDWPSASMHRILNHCTSLRSLALLNVERQHLVRLIRAIPSSVSSLTIGPSGTRLDYRSLNLHTFTSFNMSMHKSDIRALMHSGTTLRTVRKIYTYESDPPLRPDEFNMLFSTTTLERLEIVRYAKTDAEAREVLERAVEDNGYDREEVVLVPWAAVEKDGKIDAFATLIEQWKGEAYGGSGL